MKFIGHIWVSDGWATRRFDLGPNKDTNKIRDEMDAIEETAHEQRLVVVGWQMGPWKEGQSEPLQLIYLNR